MEELIPVIVVDDHAVFRDGLKALMSREGSGMKVAGEAATGAEALAVVRTHACSVLLLDVNLPDMSGFDVMASLKQAGQLPSTLVLSMHQAPCIMKDASQAGASGYLSKDVDFDYLCYAIKRVAQGLNVWSQGKPLAAATINNPLSAREQQVLSLILAGWSLNRIAEHLNRSPKTVSTHKARIMEKLGAQSDMELFKLATVQ